MQCIDLAGCEHFGCVLYPIYTYIYFKYNVYQIYSYISIYIYFHVQYTVDLLEVPLEKLNPVLVFLLLCDDTKRRHTSNNNNEKKKKRFYKNFQYHILNIYKEKPECS